MNLRIRELRIQKNISLSALARSADISKSALSNIENNKKDPRLSTLERIALVLEVKVSDLLEE